MLLGLGLLLKQKRFYLIDPQFFTKGDELNNKCYWMTIVLYMVDVDLRHTIWQLYISLARLGAFRHCPSSKTLLDILLLGLR